MERGAEWEAGAYRSRRWKLKQRLLAQQDLLKMEFSFPVTTDDTNKGKHKTNI